MFACHGHDVILSYLNVYSDLLPLVIQDMGDMRYALTEQKREIHLLKELVKAMRSSNPNARALGTGLVFIIKKLSLWARGGRVWQIGVWKNLRIKVQGQKDNENCNNPSENVFLLLSINIKLSGIPEFCTQGSMQNIFSPN